MSEARVSILKRGEPMPDEARAINEFRVWTVLFLIFLFLLPASSLIGNVTGNSEEEIPVAPPTRQTWLDIAVDDIVVKRPTASNNLYPGQTVRLDIYLIHDDRPYQSDIVISKGNNNQFTTVLVIDDGYQNVTTQYKFVSSMNINYTGVDEPGAGAKNPPFIVSFYWTVPNKPPSGVAWDEFQYNLYATATVDDDDKSDNFRSGAGVRITTPDFSPYIYEEGQDDEKGKSPFPIWANVGETLAVPFELQNRGPAVDIIGVEVLKAPEGWNVEGLQPRTVYPNDHEDLTLPVQISKNPFLSQSDEDYEVICRAYSKLYAGPYNEPPEHTFVFNIRRMPEEINNEI